LPPKVSLGARLSDDDSKYQIRRRLIDGASTTKYYVNEQQLWLRYQMTRPTIITSYDVTSGNDSAGRDLENWTIEGSLDGYTWTVLDTRTNQTLANRLVAPAAPSERRHPRLVLFRDLVSQASASAGARVLHCPHPMTK
jgi:hypothetical protein